MGNEDSHEAPLSAEDVKKRNISKMDLETRTKIKKGVNYNMRIIIRGEVKTGKTSLWQRLQGLGFSPEYHATHNIQVCHVPWSYKITDDVVKLEIWEVVDKAKQQAKRKPDSDKLKLKNTEDKNTEASDEEDDEFVVPLPPKNLNDLKSGSHTVAPDASNIDVIRGSHGVIFTFDPSREWTWTYIQRELPKIPRHIRILVLANYRDTDRREVKVTNTEVKQFCRRQGKHVYCLEASMKDCYGLLGVKTFLNLPFLELQREHLEQALYQNECEERAVFEEYNFSANLEYEGWKHKVKLHQEALPREIVTYRRPNRALEVDNGSEEQDTPTKSPTPTPEVLSGEASPSSTRAGFSSIPDSTPVAESVSGSSNPKKSPPSRRQPRNPRGNVKKEQQQQQQIPEVKRTDSVELGRVQEQERKEREREQRFQEQEQLKAEEKQREQEKDKKEEEERKKNPPPEPKKAAAPKRPPKEVISSGSSKHKPKDEGIFAFVGSVFGGEAEEEDVKGDDELVDNLRKLAAERKEGILPDAPVEDVTQFAPEIDEDAGFWSDDGPAQNVNEESEESSEEARRRQSKPAMLGDEEPEYSD